MHKTRGRGGKCPLFLLPPPSPGNVASAPLHMPGGAHVYSMTIHCVSEKDPVKYPHNARLRRYVAYSEELSLSSATTWLAGLTIHHTTPQSAVRPARHRDRRAENDERQR